MKNKLYGLRSFNINYILSLQGLNRFLSPNLVLNEHIKNKNYTYIFKMMTYDNFTYFIFKKIYNYIKDPTEYNLFIIKKIFYSIDLSLVNYNEINFLFFLLFYYNTDLKLFDKNNFFYFRLYNYVKNHYLKYKFLYYYHFIISILKEQNIFNEIQKCPYI